MVKFKFFIIFKQYKEPNDKKNEFIKVDKKNSSNYNKIKNEINKTSDLIGKEKNNISGVNLTENKNNISSNVIVKSNEKPEKKVKKILETKKNNFLFENNFMKNIKVDDKNKIDLNNKIFNMKNSDLKLESLESKKENIMKITKVFQLKYNNFTDKKSSVVTSKNNNSNNMIVNCSNISVIESKNLANSENIFPTKIDENNKKNSDEFQNTNFNKENSSNNNKNKTEEKIIHKITSILNKKIDIIDNIPLVHNNEKVDDMRFQVNIGNANDINTNDHNITNISINSNKKFVILVENEYKKNSRLLKQNTSEDQNTTNIQNENVNETDEENINSNEEEFNESNEDNSDNLEEEELENSENSNSEKVTVVRKDKTNRDSENIIVIYFLKLD